ncbi:hypothetical protein MTR67_017470 [Solanum verrucosum]|uniref:Integrase zinc-binding domain-containing protein n=1 Tax=Solanum verrucosum TaxID=315347 RepID=A0AAF0TS91_SOLVR|nr:hypothetical protein MTR67_017470 [Solanum verrucosum]
MLDVKVEQDNDPTLVELKKTISEAHNSRYSIHLVATMMYRDLREVYWWNEMKKDILEFVAKCPNCKQVKVEHQKLGGPELVHEVMEKVRLIRNRMRRAWSRHKYYVHMRRKELKFDVDDWIYLKISPMKGVMRFDLAYMHPIFHVSFLKKCIGDPTTIVLLEDVRVKESLSYKDVPVETLDCQVRKLRNKEVASMKVLWMNQLVEPATWEGKAY